MHFRKSFIELFSFFKGKTFCSKLFSGASLINVCVRVQLCQLLLESIAVGAVLCMVSLQLTGVCLPTEVLAVDEGDSLISLGASLVLSMGVNTVRWGPLGLMGFYLFGRGGLELNVVRFGRCRRLVLSWLGHNLVLRCDHCYFHCV